MIHPMPASGMSETNVQTTALIRQSSTAKAQTRIFVTRQVSVKAGISVNCLTSPPRCSSGAWLWALPSQPGRLSPATVRTYAALWNWTRMDAGFHPRYAGVASPELRRWPAPERRAFRAQEFLE